MSNPNPNVSNNGLALVGGFGVNTPGGGGGGPPESSAYASSDLTFVTWTTEASLPNSIVLPAVYVANNTGIPPDTRFLWLDQTLTPAVLKYYDFGTASWTAVSSPFEGRLPPALVASTVNQSSLSGTVTIDSISCGVGVTVLLTAQTTGSQNGFWVVQSGAWVRPSWYASGITIPAGSYTWVAAGTANGAAVWYLSGSTSITVGSSSTTWLKVNVGSGSGSVTSIFLTMPSWFDVSPSTAITSSGTFNVTPNASQAGNQVIASNTDGTTGPFGPRRLVPEDLPNPPVLAVSTSNIASLAGSAVIDGVTANAGALVLLVGQTTGSQNGPWIVDTTWMRPPWYLTGQYVNPGFVLWAYAGTDNGEAMWFLTGTSVYLVDTSATTWAKFSNGSKTFQDRFTADGTHYDYVITRRFDTGSEQVYIQGQLVDKPDQYTISGNTITTTDLYPAGIKIRVIYQQS